MQGLSVEQLVKITNFIQKHHKFGYVKEEDQIKGELGYHIKYIDACYDSRQNDYWSITFRGFGSINFNTNAFRWDGKPNDFIYTSLYEWITAFLNYDWKQGDKTYDFMNKEKEGPLHNNFPNGILETEWSDIDMINAYCADLEDGTTTEDIQDATQWIIDYRNKKNKLQS